MGLRVILYDEDEAVRSFFYCTYAYTIADTYRMYTDAVIHTLIQTHTQNSVTLLPKKISPKSLLPQDLPLNLTLLLSRADLIFLFTQDQLYLFG
jgi:hypothetical protein